VRLGVGVLLALPFFLVVVLARVGVPAWGDRIARRASSVVTALRLGRPVSLPKAALPPDPPASATLQSAGAIEPLSDAGPLEGTRARPRDAPPAAPPVAVAVRISAATVQWAIDDRGAHIHAKTARGADGRPAGIRLSGVSALGIGLRDGDMIVAVEGAPALDEDAATDLALSAVARGGSTLHATAMRGDRSFSITAELPLPPAPAARASGKAR
jgi:hypothetical protein